jgi:Flp pilus assembly protein CpaB
MRVRSRTILGMRARRIVRSRILLWALAITVGWATANVVARAREEGRSWGRRQAGVVAVVPVRAGVRVRRSDVATRSVPVALLPPDAVGSTAAIVGRVARVPLSVGQIIVGAQMAGPRQSTTEVLVGAERRALAVATGDARPPLQLGDHVDVIAGRGAGAGPDGVIAADAEVVHVAERSVTIAVGAEDAVALARAMASGPLLLALRGG